MQVSAVGALSINGGGYGADGTYLQSTGTGGAPVWAYMNVVDTAAVSASGTITNTVETVFVNAITSGISLVLQNPVGNIGYTVTLKRTDLTTANTVSISADGGTGLIEGLSSYGLNSRCGITLVSDGSNYWISSQYTPPVALAAPQLLSTMGGNGVATVTFDPVDGATDYVAEITPV